MFGCENKTCRKIRRVAASSGRSSNRRRRYPNSTLALCSYTGHEQYGSTFLVACRSRQCLCRFCGEYGWKTFLPSVDYSLQNCEPREKRPSPPKLERPEWQPYFGETRSLQLGKRYAHCRFADGKHRVYPLHALELPRLNGGQL